MEWVVFTNINGDTMKIELVFSGDHLKEARIIYIPQKGTVNNIMIISCVDITGAPFLDQCYDTVFAIAKQMLESYDFELTISKD